MRSLADVVDKLPATVSVDAFSVAPDAEGLQFGPEVQLRELDDEETTG
jgi:hypothetical protein